MLNQSTHAENVYSVASLKMLCNSENPENKTLCKMYLHGVIETWLLNDIDGVEPNRYSSKNNLPTYCDTINKISSDEWIKIVQEELNTMDSGFGASAVMEILSKKLCK